MAKPPSFQWYPKDCDTDEDVRGMDDREFGFYMRCLNHAWLNDGLPTDPSELARVMGKTKNYVDKIWKRVGKKFEIKNGRLVNSKQEIQRGSVREFIESKRSAANTRWDAKKKACMDDAHALHEQCPALKAEAVCSSPSVFSSEGESAERGNGAAEIIPFLPEWKRDEVFARFADEYGSLGKSFIDEDFAAAYQFEWKPLDWEQRLLRVQALKAHREEYRRDPTFIYMPRNFIKQEWKRKAREPPRKNQGATEADFSMLFPPEGRV